MSMWQEWLTERAEQRAESGLTRSLTPRGPGGFSDPIDLAGNDYLGLSGDPKVTAAAADAAITWGAGSRASRLVTGTLRLHERLENALAEWTGQPSALVFSTGYQANLGAVAGLADADTLVVSDAHVHASLVDAVRLSRAQKVITPHNDVEAVADALAEHAGTSNRRAIVLTESVFSVLGDEAPLVPLAEACADHGALLLVDEAHGLGVRGAGLVAETGLAEADHVLVTATLSKALGAQGGAVLGTEAIVEHLLNTARPFVYDTALAPSAAAAALAAVDVIRSRPDLAATVAARMTELADTLGVEPASGAVLSVPMAGPEQAVAAAAAALDAGVRVGCFRPPSVPDGVSRLRITVNARLDDVAWKQAVDTVAHVVQEHA